MTDDVTVHHGDALDVLAGMPDASVDAVCTDPPYGLEFMGKDWDRPWAVSASNSVGYEGRDDLRLPAHRDSRNANCRACGGRQRGAKRCSCESPQWDRSPAEDMHAYQQWCEAWAVECLRLLKPGGHLLAFGGTRTFHRLACAIEDAGFEIRDTISWLYGSGFPKSLDVSKAIDKAARGVPQGGVDPTSPNHGKYRTTTTEGKRWDGDSGQGYGAGGSRFLADGTASGGATAPAASGVAETAPNDDARRWQGWGTALKPAWEPVIVARKPLAGTVASTVLAHGTGALNIDGCRVGDEAITQHGRSDSENTSMSGRNYAEQPGRSWVGRWPANVVLDEDAAAQLDRQSGTSVSAKRVGQRTGKTDTTSYGAFAGQDEVVMGHDDSGGASRFYYTAKAAPDERPRVNGVSHPTVKPLDLMRWLVRLVTPPGGTVLDPFAGSGTTGEACIIEGFRAVLIEREADYLPLIEARLSKPIQPTLGGTA